MSVFTRRIREVQQKMRRNIILAGEYLRKYYLSQWEKGKGGNNRQMRRLSQDYAKRKREQLGKALPDLRSGDTKSGHVLDSFGIKKATDKELLLGFSNDRTTIAILNSYRKRRPNVFKLLRRIKKDIRDILND